MLGISQQSECNAPVSDAHTNTLLRTRFGWYSVVFTLLVASHHVYGFEALYARYSVLQVIVQFWQKGISLVSSEAFFVLSGYLFFKSYRPSLSCYRDKLMRRVRTLLVPYLFWVSLGILDNILLEQEPLQWPNLFAWLGLTSKYPSVVALWYVRDLFVLCLLSPLLFLLVRRKWVGLGCLALMSSLFLFGMPWYFQTLRNGFWFGIGAYLALHSSSQFLLRSRRLWLLPLLAMWLLTILVIQKVVPGLGIPFATLETLCALAGIPVIWDMLGHLRAPALLRHLLPHVFLYYCVHMKVVSLLAAVWLAVFPTTEFLAVAGFFFVPILGFMGCVAAGEASQRYVSWLYGLITGGRGTRKLVTT